MSKPHDPTHAEAPLVAIILTDVTKMSEAEATAFQAKLRAFRSVPAQRTAAVTKSKKNIESNAAGLSIDSLL